MRQQARADERKHGVAGGQQNLRLRLKRFGLQTMLQRRAVPLLRGRDIVLARGIDRFGVPAKSGCLFDSALNVVAQRTGPVNGESSAELMPQIHRVFHAELRVLANFGSFSRGTGSPHRVMERLGSNHGAFHAVILQRLSDAAHDLPLSILPQRLCRNYVGVMRGPVSYADFSVFPDNFLETDLWTRGRVKQRLTLIRGRPLRPG